MKTNLPALILLAAIAAPSTAQEATINPAPIPIGAPTLQYVTVRQLAEKTGLSPKLVRMVVGVRSSHAEYRISFDRVQKQFRNALGEERYKDLLAGRKIVLYNHKAATVARVEVKPDRNPMMAP